MLQTSVRDRLTSIKLCTELDRLLRSANAEIDNLSEDSRNTDPMVLRALLNIEDDAQEQKSSKPTTTPLNPPPIRQPHDGTLKPLQKTSRDERLKSIPLGHTTHRKPIIINELSNNTIIEENTTDVVGGRHGGATTESPIHEHPIEGLPHVGRVKPRHPGLQNNGRRSPAPPHAEPSDRAYHHGSFLSVENQELSVPSQHRSNGSSTIASGRPYDSQSDKGHARQDNHIQNSGSSLQPSNGSPPTKQSDFIPEAPVPNLPPSNYIYNVTKQVSASERSSNLPNEFLESPVDHIPQIPRQQTPNSPSSSPNGPPVSRPSPTSPYHTVIKNTEVGATPSTISPSTSQTEYIPSTNGDVPRLTANPSPRRPNFYNNASYELNSAGDHQGTPIASRPNITITHPAGPRASNETTRKRFSGLLEKEAVESQSKDDSLAVRSFEQLPLSIFGLPYDVCRVRREVENEDPKGLRASVKGFLGLEKRKADKGLAKTYGDEREIVSIRCL
jgi:hypothetical protein